jgi:pantothenate synthetase
LLKAQDSFSKGERSADRLRSIVREVLDKESLFQVDYVSLADETTLVEVKGILKKHSLLMVAVQLGDVRLLDNVELVL